jgi:predicted nucleic acid-binding Zn ribbon protein
MEEEMKKLLLLLSLVVSGFFTTTALAADSGSQDMYRLYNPNSGEHFYTANRTEAQNLVNVGWSSEGTGFVVPKKSNTPVYRLYNANAGDHHYTTNANEKNQLVSVGWKYEGIGWYSSDAKKVKLLRAYNPNARAGSHNYTTNAGEQRNLLSVGWRDEGVAWYAIGAGKASPILTSPNVNNNSTILKAVVAELKREFADEDFDDEVGSVSVEEGGANSLILNFHMKYAIPGIVTSFKADSDDLREAHSEIKRYIPNVRFIVNIYNPGNVLAGSFTIQ